MNLVLIHSVQSMWKCQLDHNFCRLPKIAQDYNACPRGACHTQKQISHKKRSTHQVSCAHE